jgi:hypothetical protein
VAWIRTLGFQLRWLPASPTTQSKPKSSLSFWVTGCTKSIDLWVQWLLRVYQELWELHILALGFWDFRNPFIKTLPSFWTAFTYTLQISNTAPGCSLSVMG